MRRAIRGLNMADRADGMRRARTRPPTRWAVGAAAGLLIVLAGCAPAARIELVQPSAPVWQQEVLLESDQARWGKDAEVERVLAEFPLPGARTGEPTFLLYLRVPAGPKEVSFAAATAPRAAGFLIQTRGELAGLTTLAKGRLTVHGRSDAPSASRTLEIDATCEDGTTVRGAIRAVRDDYRLSRFEQYRRPVDVEKLMAEHPTVPPPEKPSSR